MNTLTISSATHAAARFPPYPRRPFSSNSFSLVAFRCPRQTPSSLSLLAPIRASSDNPTKFLKLQVPKKNYTPQLSSIPFLGALKTGLVTTVAAVAVFFAGFCFAGKPLIAKAVTETPGAHTSVSEEEKERFLEEQLHSNPNDLEALKSLMEIKIQNEKIPHAIEILHKLIECEPDEDEWPLLKSHLYAHIKEYGFAKDGFLDVLNKDPFRVEAYHGLVVVASQEGVDVDLKNVEGLVEEAMKLCKKENKKEVLRQFKLLIAQIRVIEGQYEDALKVYQTLENEEPRDFRPYLCKGIIYTLLRKNDEAERNFDKYRRLVPKEHPYASYFDDNMIATKIFAQRMENEIAMSRS